MAQEWYAARAKAGAVEGQFPGAVCAGYSHVPLSFPQRRLATICDQSRLASPKHKSSRHNFGVRDLSVNYG